MECTILSLCRRLFYSSMRSFNSHQIIFLQIQKNTRENSKRMKRWPCIRIYDTFMKIFLNFIKIFNLFREKRKEKSKMTILLSSLAVQKNRWLQINWDEDEVMQEILWLFLRRMKWNRLDDIFYAHRLSVTQNTIRKIIKSDWTFLDWTKYSYLLLRVSILSVRLHSFIIEIECKKIHSRRISITNSRKLVKVILVSGRI